MKNALTIDVEDYYHVSGFAGVLGPGEWSRLESRVERNTYGVLELLDRFNARATFFFLGWVAARYPRLVMDVAASGHELGCHGYAHKLVYEQDAEDFRLDVREAKEVIEDASGRRVESYRAPSFSITRGSLWALDMLADEGFRYDSSIFPVCHDRYGIPGWSRFPHVVALPSGKELLEFPPSTMKILGLNIGMGGGYLRMFPVSFTRAGIQRLNDGGQPAMIYLHPWELDPGQPRVPGWSLRHFRHYHNLSKTESKLVRLLEEFEFGTTASVLAQIGETRLGKETAAFGAAVAAPTVFSGVGDG